MAIPTSFIIYTPVAAATKTCPLVGHNGASPTTPNIALIDVLGTATPKMIVLEANMSIVMTATFTDAQVAVALKNYLQSMGVRSDGAAGGYPTQDSKQITPTHSTCT